MYRANLIGSKAIGGFEVVDGGLTVTAGGLIVTAGGLTVSSGNVSITDNLSVNGDVTLGDSIADTITLSGALTSNVTYTTAGTWCYFRSTISATSGDHNNARFRVQASAASANTGEQRAIYAQGISSASLYGGTVTALQVESIAKNATTVTTLRGIFVAVDSEDTPTSITNMHGIHCRMKTSVAPATDYYNTILESEKFGSGVALDAFLYFKSTTWQAANTIATNIIDMSGITGTATTGIEFGSNLTLTQAINVTGAGIQRLIDVQNTPTTADRMIYMNIDYGASTKEAMYIIAKSATNSGETIAIRGRAEGKHGSASGGEHRGGFFQGIAFASLYAGTVTGVQSEAIAKDQTSVTTVRGAFFAADSEDTPTSITNMYGQHTRVKTSVAPGTDFIVAVFETEKFGAGVALDSFIQFKTTTWSSGNTVSSAVLDCSGITGDAGCFAKFNDDQKIAWDTENTGTAAGAIQIDVGGATRYIQLYSDTPT